MLSALLFLSSPASATERGTFYAGAKFWYTIWDSGALEWFGDLVDSFYRSFDVPITVDSETGTGYLAGPLLGYQTPNGKLNISFTPMILSHSSQETEVRPNGADVNAAATSIDLERKDYDFAVSYSLADLKKISPFFLSTASCSRASNTKQPR